MRAPCLTLVASGETIACTTRSIRMNREPLTSTVTSGASADFTSATQLFDARVVRRAGAERRGRQLRLLTEREQAIDARVSRAPRRAPHAARRLR